MAWSFVWIAVALTIVIAVVHFDDALTELDHRAQVNAARPYLDRAYGDDGSIVGSREVIEAARLRMPRDSTYMIVAEPGGAAFNAEVAPEFLRYFLFPRRESQNARWVLCLGCDVTALGKRFKQLAERDGIVFGRLFR